mmetsp:Transcript_32390/g.54571  ORF Transcript_32390/g.54571 Transcript_32390/m.54571 type:complete len:95 (+) Transcript_32390:221-505(+)
MMTSMCIRLSPRGVPFPKEFGEVITNTLRIPAELPSLFPALAVKPSWEVGQIEIKPPSLTNILAFRVGNIVAVFGGHFALAMEHFLEEHVRHDP